MCIFLLKSPWRWLICAAISTSAAAIEPTSQPSTAPSRGKQLEYPRINPGLSLKVDPAWPTRLTEMPWGETPGVAVDSEDNVLVYTRAAPPIQVYSASGKFVRAWGEGLIRSPHMIRCDRAGNIWVADTGNHVVMQFSPQGKLLKTLGTSGVPGEDETHFDKPTDVAVAAGGDIFVSDGYGNNRIVHCDAEGRFVKAWGRMGTAPGEFSIPHSLALDSRGRLYVADRNNARIQVFEQDGSFVAEWRGILIPWGLFITRDDEIWVCGSTPMDWTEGERVLGVPPKDQIIARFDSQGKLQQLWSVPKGIDGAEKPGECNWVHGIAIDSSQNVYVSEIRGKRVQKFLASKSQR